MTVPIRVNDQGPFAFVVDTGANQSVISFELAQRLSLLTGPAAPLNGVAGIKIEPTTIATLDLGGRKVERVLSLLPAADVGGDGMLGLDGLDGQMLTLDFGGQTIRIEDSRRRPTAAGEVSVRASRRNGPLTLVDADLAGMPLVAFLDSGAQSTIGNMALLSQATPRTEKAQWSITPIISATGQTIPAQMADLPNLRVGRLHLPHWPVAFADLHVFQMWNLTDKPAILLGVDILSRFRTVCLDFARDEVRFHLPGA